jgi:CSLREA domain-containing protein
MKKSTKTLTATRLSIPWVMLCFTLTGCPSPAIFNVNTTSDLLDSDPGDGVCATAGGQCSLRAAIQEVNASAATSNIEINLVSSGTYLLTLNANGDDGFVITPPAKAVRISGCCANPGQTTIRPDGLLSRIFTIQAGAVTLERLRLTNANATGLGASGGAVRVDGSSELFVDQCSFEDNRAEQGRGAGIYVEEGNLNVVQITDSVFRDNSAANAGIGGAGGVDGHAAFSITGSLFEGNEGNGGALRLRDANGLGGPPAHRIVRSTFRSNRTENSGGGGGVRIDVEDDSVLVSNSTFSGNDASPTIGGGISVLSGNVEIQNSTFAENTAGEEGEGHALFVASSSNVRVRNTLIADNGPFGNESEVSCAGADALTLAGFNLIESIDEDCDFLDESPVDQDDTGPVDPDLSSYTQMPIGHYPLQSTSPAIDHGPPACGPMEDQIGNPRPVDGDNAGGPGCDTGAIEFQGD